MALHYRKKYRNAEGKIVPGVTTVNKNLGWGSRGLMYWANTMGLAGKNMEEAREEVTAVGNYAHLAVEAAIKGQPFDLDAIDMTSDERKLVGHCLLGWERWREQSRFEMLASEIEMVSEDHQYGGCCDVVAVHNRRAMLDLKTGAAIYSENLIQIRAYGELWNENNPDEPIEEYHLLRVGKEDASFHHHSWPAMALDDEWAAFLHLRALHGMKTRMEKRCK